MASASPAPRRIKAPSWFDLRLVLGVALVLASVLLGARLVSGAKHTDPVLALTRDLAAGSTVQEEDVTTVQVHLADRSVYLSNSADVIGKQTNRSLARGELLPVSAVDAEPALTTVSVPFAVAAAPQLRAGGRIEVWLSSKTCSPLVLLADATVQQVDSGQGSFGTGVGQNVVLSLPAALAERVVDALALPDATIRAGVLTGPAVAHANDALPPLDGCMSAAHTS
ncbi:MAG: SAF domain-containing protein [Jatrophihabitantaceae bacterium]